MEKLLENGKDFFYEINKDNDETLFKNLNPFILMK